MVLCPRGPGADSAAIEDIPSSMQRTKETTMNESTNPTPCTCSTCPGTGCTCGCQPAATQTTQAVPPAACPCGPQCACGPACSCARS